ncbi:MAG: transferrin receptor-like dimerization domain-containing protein [Terriglobales bacterium]
MRRIAIGVAAAILVMATAGQSQAPQPAQVPAEKPQAPVPGELAGRTAPDRTMRGYAEANARAERQWEEKFRAIPKPENMKAAMQRLSARPHHVGSPYDLQNEQWLLSTFQSWGLDAHIETFNVLFPTPKQRLVELLEPVKFTATLQEPAVVVDPTSNQQPEQLPTYNAYSIDGDVTASLVYVNYGIPDDYERLERMGISVKGAIVIARYGKSWRGIKPKVAAEHGAVGCIIYSDPRDDGYFQGDVFPKGAWRNPNGVQRGSVMDMPTYPGDPLTPGIGATKDAKRLAIGEVKTLTKIPVLPISYADATPLLQNLGGPVAPESWRGALGFTYHVGPGPAKVHLVVKSNWDIKPVNDVIVKIAGSSYPDEWIVRGNHYDAWVNGADDPVSGEVALMEELRAYSELLKQGWKPKRTIIYASWDGEEPGLLGSTEWAEAHADELRQHAVAYINSDSNSRGYLGLIGSHTLEELVNDVARDITDPEKKISVWKRAQLQRIRQAREDERRGGMRDDEDREERNPEQLRKDPSLHLDALGSGSDYTVFLDHLGIASLNIGYGGEGGGGIYHSIYDDFYWYTHFDDADLLYGRALAQTGGTLVMRLADADVLPFSFGNFTDTIRRYLEQLEKLAKDKRDAIVERNREIDEGAYTATADPKLPYVPPAKEAVPPSLNFGPMQNGLTALTRASQHYRSALDRAQQAGLDKPANVAAVNRSIMQSERAMTLPDGLPQRPWFQHQIYAPGFYTGYGVKTIPGVREAIEQKQWSQAEAQIARVGQVLQNEAKVIEEAAAVLEK